MRRKWEYIQRIFIDSCINISLPHYIWNNPKNEKFNSNFLLKIWKDCQAFWCIFHSNSFNHNQRNQLRLFCNKMSQNKEVANAIDNCEHIMFIWLEMGTEMQNFESITRFQHKSKCYLVEENKYRYTFNPEWVRSKSKICICKCLSSFPSLLFNHILHKRSKSNKIIKQKCKKKPNLERFSNMPKKC